MKAKAFIPTDKIIERLRYENPWWISQEIPSGYKNMSKRFYFNLFQKSFGINGATSCG